MKIRRRLSDTFFQKFIETESYTAVADDLNTRKINPPAVYHKTGEVYCPPDAATKDGIKVVWNALLKVTLTLESWYRERPALLQRDENNRIHKPEDDWVVKKKPMSR